MHSSRMHTARLLTVSQHVLHRGGVYPSMHWVCVCVYPSMHCAGGCIPACTGRRWCLRGRGGGRGGGNKNDTVAFLVLEKLDEQFKIFKHTKAEAYAFIIFVFVSNVSAIVFGLLFWVDLWRYRLPILWIMQGMSSMGGKGYYPNILNRFSIEANENHPFIRYKILLN